MHDHAPTVISFRDNAYECEIWKSCMGGVFKGPAMRPCLTSLSILSCRTCGCWCADVKFLELTGSRGPEYINLKSLSKPSPSASADDLSGYLLKWLLMELACSGDKPRSHSPWPLFELPWGGGLKEGINCIFFGWVIARNGRWTSLGFWLNVGCELKQGMVGCILLHFLLHFKHLCKYGQECVGKLLYNCSHLKWVPNVWGMLCIAAGFSVI